MNIIGNWKISHVLSFDDTEGKKWITAEEYENSNQADRSSDQLVKSTFRFTEDGKMLALFPIPEGVSQEEIDEAVAGGKVKIVDGMICMEENKWKEEDGAIKVCLGKVSTNDAAPIDNWDTLKFDGDSFIMMVMFKFSKID